MPEKHINRFGQFEHSKNDVTLKETWDALVELFIYTKHASIFLKVNKALLEDLHETTEIYLAHFAEKED